MTHDTPSPDQLEHEALDHMNRAVAAAEAIRDRVTGLHLAENAIHATRDAGGTFALNLGRAVRDNPVPAALLGVGLVWLAAAGRHHAADGAGDGPVYEATPVGYDAGPAPIHDVEEVEDGPPARSVGAASVRDQAAQFADAAAERAHRARQAAEDAADEAGGRVRRASRRVTTAAGRAAGGAVEYGKAHPVLVVLGAFAVGAAVAAILPRTRRENRAMGDAADQTRRYVRDQAEDAADRAKRAARRAADVARETAETEAARAAAVAADAGHQAADVVREEIHEATGTGDEPHDPPAGGSDKPRS